MGIFDNQELWSSSSPATVHKHNDIELKVMGIGTMMIFKEY